MSYLSASELAELIGCRPNQKSRICDVFADLGDWVSISKSLAIAAADEIERYYGGMLAWKKTAEAHDQKAGT